MKDKKVTWSESIETVYNEFGHKRWLRAEFSGTLEDGETEDNGYSYAKQQVHNQLKAHRERYPESYSPGELSEAQYKSFAPEQIPVVQMEKINNAMVEMALMDIEKCTEIDGIGGLKSFRWIINQDPKIKEAYDKKLQELQKQ